jgi:hypothetical protein
MMPLCSTRAPANAVSTLQFLTLFIFIIPGCRMGCINICNAVVVFSGVLLLWCATCMASAPGLEKQHVTSTTRSLHNRASEHRRQGAGHVATKAANANRASVINGGMLRAGSGQTGRNILQSVILLSASRPHCRKLLQPLAAAPDGKQKSSTAAPVAEPPQQQYRATEQQVQVLQQYPGLYVGGGEHSKLSMTALASQYAKSANRTVRPQPQGNNTNKVPTTRQKQQQGNINNSSSSLISVSSMEAPEDDGKLGHGFPAVYLQQHPGQVLPPAEQNLGPLNTTVGLNTTISNTTVDGPVPSSTHGARDSHSHQVLRRRILSQGAAE